MAKLQVSKKHQKAIYRLIKETDWDKFWNTVTEKASDEIEAYRIARAKSLAHVQTFI